MPIYAYQCASCGTAKDVLQKLSDPALTDCPACGQASLRKQLTAAGFQLKGNGWYATDFRGSTQAPAQDSVADNAADSATNSKVADSATQAEPSVASGHGCGSGCNCA